jgi:hypothetical protein
MAGGPVFPDLVVHDRTSRRRNLLALEAKHNPSLSDRRIDHRKLEAYRTVLGYKHAVFLELPAGGAPPLWTWLDASTSGPEPVA